MRVPSIQYQSESGHLQKDRKVCELRKAAPLKKMPQISGEVHIALKTQRTE